MASLSASKSPLTVNLPFAIPMRFEMGVSLTDVIFDTGFPFPATVIESSVFASNKRISPEKSVSVSRIFTRTFFHFQSD